MRPYEAMVILVPSLDDTGIQAAVERIARLIVDQGGSVDRINPWGKRRLAYEVAGHNDGFYLVVDFRGEESTVTEMERVLRLNDAVLRHIIVRQEEVPVVEAEETPSDSEPAVEDADPAAEANSEAAGDLAGPVASAEPVGSASQAEV